MGLSRDLELRGIGRAAGFELGLMVHTISYRLSQYDNVELIGRTLDEGWVEWTPTWGLSLRFPEFQVRYRRAGHARDGPAQRPVRRGVTARRRRRRRRHPGRAERTPQPHGSQHLHPPGVGRSEEHTSELQSLAYLVCRLLLEKKKNNKMDK